MDKFTQLRIFTRVAERGGFSAAARDIGITQSAVSKAVTALESSLGVRLVSRTTQRVSLTEAGKRYYQRCRDILADLEEADAAAVEAQGSLSGELNIAAPVPFGLMFISPRIPRFQARHPGLRVNFTLDDRLTDLVRDNVDIAIRGGLVGSPEVAARKLGDSPFITVAAPAYLARHGTPARPEALTEHDCLTYGNLASPGEWDFETRDGPRRISVSGSYRSNNLLALKDAALAGSGIARLPLWMADAELKTGALRTVLEDTPPPPFAIYAVFPSPRRIPAKARLFADFIQDELASVSYFLGWRPALRGEG